MSKDGKIASRAAAALLLLSLSLGGCATSTAGSSLMDARAEAPARPKEADGYLPVHDLPPKREKPAMTADERLKLEKELIAARDRQVSAGKAKRERCARSTHEPLDSESSGKQKIRLGWARTHTKNAGLRSRAHVVGEGLKSAASARRVFLLIWQARQSAGSLSPAAGFEVRPKESAGKIDWPTAVHTVFEGPGECS